MSGFSFIRQSEFIRNTDLRELRKSAQDFFFYLVEEEQTKLSVQGKIDAWTTAWELVAENEVPSARKALEDEFRSILGVSDSSSEKE